jgi:hypothetical protein
MDMKISNFYTEPNANGKTMWKKLQSLEKGGEEAMHFPIFSL